MVVSDRGFTLTRSRATRYTAPPSVYGFTLDGHYRTIAGVGRVSA